jgi:hypothetical protein
VTYVCGLKIPLVIMAYNPGESSIVLLTGEGDGFTILPPKVDTPVGEWILKADGREKYGIVLLTGNDAEDRQRRRKGEEDWKAKQRRPDPTMTPDQIRQTIAREEEY